MTRYEKDVLPYKNTWTDSKSVTTDNNLDSSDSDPKSLEHLANSIYANHSNGKVTYNHGFKGKHYHVKGTSTLANGFVGHFHSPAFGDFDKEFNF